MKRQTQYLEAGFTIVELIVVMVLMGVLSAVAIPKLAGDSSTAVSGFSYQVASALRYAQTAAVAHRRLVCASLGASVISLQIATTEGAQVCSQVLPPVSGASFASPDSKVTLSPATLYFQPDGTITSDVAGATPVGKTTLTISATNSPAKTVTLWGATGYVE